VSGDFVVCDGDFGAKRLLPLRELKEGRRSAA
jgi:hypothetical protein